MPDDVPSPFIHLEVADAVGPVIGVPAGGWPAFLLGAVAADLDKIAGRPRSSTHFWDVGDDTSGALKLLAAHPHLAARDLPAAARAFVGGYLCHLVADEQWTFVIYRRYFGRYSRYGASAEGHDVQLGLQAVLELRQHTDWSGLEETVAALAAAEVDALPAGLMPFLPPADLRRWREAVVAMAGMAPGLDRLRFSSALMSRDADLVRREMAGRGGDLARVPPGQFAAAVESRRAAFAARFPALQGEAARYVAPDALDEFRQRAVDESRAFAGDYLAGRPLQPPRGTTGAARL
jgi:hypothetical protein